MKNFNLKLRITTIFYLFFTTIIIYAQSNYQCSEGTDISNYNFINPCSSFIELNVKPKNIGTTFDIDSNIFKNTYCATNNAYSTSRNVYGKVEFTEDFKISLKDRKDLVINVTPCKKSKYYLKDNFRYNFSDYDRHINSYYKTAWNIEQLERTPTRADSVLYLKTRKPTFGEYMALLYLEYGDRVDFDIPKLFMNFTGIENNFETFYEDYIGKSVKNIRGHRDNTTVYFNPEMVVEEYVDLRGKRDYFTAISLFFDHYYKENVENFSSRDPEQLVIMSHDFLYLNPLDYNLTFKPQSLLDKFYGEVQFGFDGEKIALEVKNPNVKDLENKPLNLNAIVYADFKYKNLPYEKIEIKKQQQIDLATFYLGKNILKIEPIQFSIDLEKYNNDNYLHFISPFHQHMEMEFPPRVISDDYIKYFIGIFITNAKLSFNIKNKSYDFDNAKLIIDEKEINGFVPIDLKIFNGEITINKLIKTLNSKGIKAEFQNNILYFRMK